ncbi:Phosphorylase b kinase regulatory subunit alpha, skeletal muscle isoform [Myotis davidii]|uniref:Phosphorylase b kinase regulatory subunit n=1 Tax=Myotis davidii TaxID=225400 RepID=L5LUH5_MYODS|nr:Phosphorylase b kinase regulatory subunit alpha, skeletal muscle isoform [Myotis davidii]
MSDCSLGLLPTGKWTSPEGSRAARGMSDCQFRPDPLGSGSKPVDEDGTSLNSSILAALRKMQDGYFGGARVQTGKLSEFLTTSCCTHLSFMDPGPESKLYSEDYNDYSELESCDWMNSYDSTSNAHCGDDVARYLDHLLAHTAPHPKLAPTSQKGGLDRFRTAVQTTCDIMSLVTKATELHVQNVHMYLPAKIVQASRPLFNLLDSPPPPQEDQVPSVRVEIHLPRDQSGEVDFKALVLQLKETSSFQGQADILYMLYTMNQITVVWHGTLLKLLWSFYTLALPAASKELLSVEQEVHWHMNQLKYKHLSLLAEFSTTYM